MKRERILLAADLSNQCYKASAAFSGLESEGRFTGGLYGFMVQVQKAIVAVDATDIVICVDSKPYIRSQLYPEYKAKRKETRDETLYENAQYSMGLIKELLAVVGWPVWEIKGFESDDLVAHAITKYRHRYKKVVAMSNDSDLFQMFKYSGFLVYRGKKGPYTRQHYDREWNIPLEHLPVALAMMGTHNDVEGVRGIGEVTAREIVASPFKLRSIMQQHKEVIDRNLQLVVLPHPDFPYEATIPPHTCSYSERKLLQFCARFEISAYRDMLDAFDQVAK